MKYRWWTIVAVTIVLIFGAGCGCIDVYPKELISSVSSDGIGNTFIAYRLERTVGDHDVHLQKIGPDGAVLWDEVLFTGDDRRAGSVSMVDGGSEGVFVAWEVLTPANGKEGSHNFDHITMARLDSQGQIQWQQDFFDEGMQMVGDDMGGVIMAWVTREDYRARRVDDHGDMLWEKKIGSGGTGLKLVVGENGESFILWDNYDSHFFMAQKVGAEGQILWEQPGVLVEYPDTAVQLEPQITSDGSGGAIITWAELMGEEGEPSYVWLQRIGADGQVLSKNVLRELTSPVNPRIRAVGDGPLGVIVVWEDLRHGMALYAMKYNPLSSFLWPANGAPVCTDIPIASPPFEAVGSGDGGVVVAWIDGDRKLYAQMLDAFGQKQWGDEGILVATGACRLSTWVCGDIENGFVFGWATGSVVYHPNDSYLQKIDANGNLLWGEDGIRLNP